MSDVLRPFLAALLATFGGGTAIFGGGTPKKAYGYIVLSSGLVLKCYVASLK